MFDVDRLIASKDLSQLVTQAGGQLDNHGRCSCPLHGGENKTAFSVYHKDGKDYWKCYTGDCGGGDLITFVQKWQNMNFKQACAWLGGDITSDPVAMEASAKARHEAARLETIAAQQREEARRVELQHAQREVVYHNNLLVNGWMRETWTSWGIDEGMQDFWNLGGCNDFFVDGEYHSPTLTIPVLNTESELMTIQHRLMKPSNPKDKYRPDRVGLRSHPYLAVPSMGFDGGLIWVMEGAKKAMVTWTRADSDWQCVGVPGQEMYRRLIDVLKPVASRVIVVPDPNAELKAHNLAKEIGARFLLLPDKIDDYILGAGIGQNDLYAMSKQARQAK